jgi:hypothetical protein
LARDLVQVGPDSATFRTTASSELPLQPANGRGQGGWEAPGGAAIRLGRAFMMLDDQVGGCRSHGCAPGQPQGPPGSPLAAWEVGVNGVRSPNPRPCAPFGGPSRPIVQSRALPVYWRPSNRRCAIMVPWSLIASKIPQAFEAADSLGAKSRDGKGRILQNHCYFPVRPFSCLKDPQPGKVHS